MRALALLMFAGAAGGGLAHAQAVFFTWTDANHSTDDNTSDALNWQGNAVPSASQSNLLNLTFGTATQGAVRLDQSIALNSITFSGNVGYGISTNSAQSLTLAGGTNGGVASGITNNTTATAQVFVSVPLILQGAVTVTNNSTTAGMLLSGNLSGSGAVTIVNNSTQPLQFTGVDSRTSGGMTISAGTFSVGDGSSITAMISGGVTNNGAILFNPGPGSAQAYSGNMTGTGSVTLSGSSAALFTLTGTNTYSGFTAVNAGTLADGLSGASLSPNSVLSVNNGSTVTINSNETIGGLQTGTGSGTINLGSGKSLTINSTGSTNAAYAGAINGSADAGVVIGGTGVTALSGANGYVGGTTINSGATLIVTNTSGSATGTNTVTINPGGTLQVGASGSGTAGAVAGGVTDKGTLSFGGGSQSSPVVFGNTVSGIGSVAVLTNASVTLTSNGNNYSGGTTINSGAYLYAGNANNGDSATGPGTVTVNSGGTLAFGLFNGSATGSAAGSITDNGTVRFNLTGAYNFGNAVSGTGGVFDTQSGTITFTNPGSKTYSGFTVISSGATIADGAAGSFSPNSVVAVAGGAGLQVGYNETIQGLIGSSNLGGTVTVASGAVLTLNTAGFTDEYQGIITGAGAVAVSGSGGSEIFTGANTYTGVTTINSGGVLQLGNTGGGPTGSIANSAGITDNGTLNVNLTTNLTLGNGITGSGVLNQQGTGALTLAGTNTYSGTTAVTNGTLQDGAANAFSPNSLVSVSSSGGLTVNYNETVAGLSGSGSVVNLVNGGTTLTLDGTANPTPLYSGTISGAGALAMVTGVGNQIFSGASTYTGGTTINAGTLMATNTAGSATGTGPIVIGSNGALQFGSGSVTNAGSVPAGSSITDNGIINFNLTTGYSFGNTVSGTGNVREINTGVLTFSGSGTKTYSGNTFIASGGTIADANAGAFSPNSTMKVSSGGSLQVNNNETVAGLVGNNSQGGNVSLVSSGVILTLNEYLANTFQGIVSGPGGVVVGGTGSQIFTGANTYSGGTTINSGATLQIGDNSSTSSAVTGSIVDNGTLVLDENTVSGSLNFTNPISGTGAVVMNSNANLVLPNANTYSGGTTIYGGTVLLANTTGSALGSGPVNVTSSTPSVVGSGGILSGSAHVTGPLTLGGGGLLFPGTFSNSTATPGTLTVASGGTIAGNSAFVFVINNATGTVGTNWSLLGIGGSLAITATSTAPVLISVNSLTAANASGAVPNFNPTQAYSWEFVSAAGGITGFTPGAFITTTATYSSGPPGFLNGTGTGSFYVSEAGNNLFLNFSPVPEPSTWALLLSGAALLAGGAWRHRRRPAIRAGAK